jgi:hypothetical protein
VGHQRNLLAGVRSGDLRGRRAHPPAQLETALAAPRPRVGHAALEALQRSDRAARDLLARKPGPCAHIELAQARIEAGAEPPDLRQDRGGVASAREVAGDHAVDRFDGEVAGQLRRLLTAAVRERRVGLALPASSGVPGGFGVAHQQEDGFGRHPQTIPETRPATTGPEGAGLR